MLAITPESRTPIFAGKISLDPARRHGVRRWVQSSIFQSYRKHFGNILPDDPLTRAHLEDQHQYDRQALKLSSSLVAFILAQDEPAFATFRL